MVRETENVLNAFSGGTFKVLTKKDGLSNDIVNALYEDGEGSLWIGTSKGLSRLKGGRFTRWTVKEWLFNDSIFVILQDDDRDAFGTVVTTFSLCHICTVCVHIM